MKVVIHAGMHKTGTTSFQKSCREAQNKLLENSIFYPDLTRIDPKSGFPLCHSDIPIALMSGDIDKLEVYLEYIAAELNRNGCYSTIISSENICSLIWKSRNIDLLNDKLTKIFDELEYVFIIRDIEDLFKSYIKQFVVHFGCDLSRDFNNLNMKLDSILKTANDFIMITENKLRVGNYEQLSSGGICNNLLRFCCPENEELKNRELLEESRSNTTEMFSRDLFQLMTPLFRALIAATEGGVNPYSRDVNIRLERLIDRRKLQDCIGPDATLNELSLLVDGGLSTICKQVVNSRGAHLLDDFPYLRQYTHP